MNLLNLVVEIEALLKQTYRLEEKIDTNKYIFTKNELVTLNGLSKMLETNEKKYFELKEADKIQDILNKYSEELLYNEFKLYYHFLVETRKFLISIIHNQKKQSEMENI